MIRFESPSVPDPLTVNGARIGAGFALLTPPTNGLAVEGAVGIGIIAPARVPLHLHNPLAAATYLHMTNAVTGSGANDGCQLVMSSNGTDVLLINRETGGTVQFQVAGISRMRINAATEVGIGVSVGSISAGLHIQKTLTQLRLDYAGLGNNWDFTVGSSGALGLVGSGAGATFTVTPTAGQNAIIALSAGGLFRINGGDIQFGVAAAAEAVVPTHTVTFRDNTGTLYKFPCLAA